MSIDGDRLQLLAPALLPDDARVILLPAGTIPPDVLVITTVIVSADVATVDCLTTHCIGKPSHISLAVTLLTVNVEVIVPPRGR